MDIHQEKLLILDFGSQYTQLIARRVRELGVYCEVLPGCVDIDLIKSAAPQAIVLSGGPQSVTGPGSLQLSPELFELNCPILGICYGMQAMVHALGGCVSAGQHAEYGLADISVLSHDGLFSGVDASASETPVWMSHGDHVTALPDGFECLAKTDTIPYAAIANPARQLYALQFHPEVTHTESGEFLLRYFLTEVANFSGTWTVSRIIEDQIERIQAAVGDEHVLLALSGGVDSSVVAALLHKAIGNQLHCVFVDTGLSRLLEVEQVQQVFIEHFKIDLHICDARAQFFEALSGVEDPEEKRRIIGHEFIAAFERQSQQLSVSPSFLAQGTIYPDVIESAGSSGHAQVIKSHHNVGGLPERMNLKLLEPIRELFKDEVRKMGLHLGLPAHLIGRHPFPGPGLAVRCLGAVDPKQIEILRRADHLFLQVLRDHDYYDKVSQALAVFLPVKAVGVKGDQRAYGYVIALRAVVTVDFMTAKWARLPDELLQDAAAKITREIDEVTRVVYDITSKPPGTIEWE